MQNFMLYRLATDSRGLVGQKLGVWAEKPYKIHDFHCNPCRHSLENLGWPPKLYHSTQNFMLYRLMTDSRGLVGQKLGVWVEKPYKMHDFHSNPCRHSLDNLVWYTDRRTIKCASIVMHPFACTDRTTLIKSTTAGSFENIQLIPLQIKDMTETLISTYENTKKLLSGTDSRKENQSIIKTTKEIAALVLSTLFLFAFSLTFLFIQWIKHIVKKRIDRLEKDVDDITHELAWAHQTLTLLRFSLMDTKITPKNTSYKSIKRPEESYNNKTNRIKINLLKQKPPEIIR